MAISAKIIADSLSFYAIDGRFYEGVRITTYQLRYPRFIHAELMTHRVFSRNASSSRAAAVLTMLKKIIKDPAMPVYWGANQSGMQAKSELTGVKRWLAKKVWRAARYPAVAAAYLAYRIGLHKQIANRICEPWAHINVLVTSTEYRNWDELRRHEDAQPEIRELANLMFEKRALSSPDRLKPGDWHLPYVRQVERKLPIDDQIKISVARCARVSYLTHDAKEPDFRQDLSLYRRLVGSYPLHASPAEHQATPDRLTASGIDFAKIAKTWQFGNVWKTPALHGNLRGFIQYRKTLTGEFVEG